MAQMGASLPPTATAAPHASAPQASAVPVLTPDALAEIEMARQRAERARRSKEVKLEPAEHHVRPEDGPGESEDPEALTPEEQEMLAASGHDGEKDVRKLKRLLRNRVSAQQARERKKQYVGQLEEEVSCRPQWPPFQLSCIPAPTPAHAPSPSAHRLCLAAAA